MSNRENGGERAGFRHELKYIVSEAEKEVIVRRMKYVLDTDAHAHNGRYMVRSLYFDDAWESAYEEKLGGSASRRKYRLRCYDYSDEVISLEVKRKEGQYIQKASARLSREETDRILARDVDFLLERQEPVCKDFYVEWMTRLMRPKVIVDYDREPYVLSCGDVRITFDMHVRAGLGEPDLFSRDMPVLEALEPGQLIMEVKFTEYLPGVVRDILQAARAAHTAASKYVLCLEKKREYTFS